MKYYSELLNKLFETEDALNQAENKHKAKEESVAEQKRTLACAIEKAEENLKAAYDAYNAVRKDAIKIVDDAQKIADSLMDEAKLNVLKAQEERTDALLEFNERFGPYKTTYTGDDAVAVNNLINDLFASVSPLFRVF